MDSESSAQFSFAFLLAILFHLLLLFLLILGLNFDPEVATKKPIAAMQATILEMPPASEEADKGVAEVREKLSRAEKKRLAYAKRQALRLEQTERKKLLAEAAQKLVLETILAKKQAQERAVIEGKIKNFWQRPAGTKGMRCVIQVELFTSGQIKKAFVIKSSGSKSFDDSAKQAIYKAEPVQIPDDEEVRQTILAGFSVHFGDE